jgi:hypothetical protein
MRKGTLERFTLAAVADALDGSDVETARDRLSAVVGAVVEVSGTVQKRVRREGECKLVIEPGDVPGFVVFADCWSDAETVRARKIRKGSFVSVRGKFHTFGASAVCLVDCQLQQLAIQKKKSSPKLAAKKKTENLTKPNISGAKTEKEPREN